MFQFFDLATLFESISVNELFSTSSNNKINALNFVLKFTI